MKKIKVAILTSYSQLPIGNGAQTFINRLICHLSHRNDIELHIITFGDETRQFKEGNSNIHMVKKIIKQPGPLTIFQVLSLKRKIMKINPDIVNIYGPSPAAYHLAAASIWNKCPVVLTMVGIGAKAKDIMYVEKEVVSVIIRLINTQTVKYVSYKTPNIILESSSIKNLISGNTANSQIYIIPNGVEFEKIQEIQSSNLNEEPDIFLVAGLIYIKGIDVLIKSIPIVNKSVDDLRVYIAGSGPQENRLKTLIKRLGLEEHVKFLGFISENEKFQYYKTCKISVIPSRWDCQPTTLLEAMASGKPVVASRVGGIPDTVDDGKTGFLFESENVEDLANKIIKLLNDEQLIEEMGNASKEKSKEYDWRRIAEKTVEAYRDIISNFHNKKSGS